MFTTEQVKSLVLSAAALAGDFQGYTPAEQIVHIADVEDQFDQWVADISTPVNNARDIDGHYQPLRVGTRIALVGNTWAYNQMQGQIVDVTGFDEDGDPLFFYGGDRRVAYGQERESYGWVLAEEYNPEDYDF